MRRSLIRTVAATTVIVLVAVLVPMAVLLARYGLEDRLARAALEAQAIETVVAGQDKGSVSVFLDDANRKRDGIRATVLYPDGIAVGPDPGEDARVREARRTGRARADDEGGGAQILVPVSGRGLPEDTPVIRVLIFQSAFVDEVRRSWLLLGLLGLALLAGSVLVADRLGRSFVQPVLGIAQTARRLSVGERSGPVPRGGPPEVDDVAVALETLVSRVEELLTRERAAVADLAHRLRTPVTRLRLAVDTLDVDDEERVRIGEYVDAVDRTADEVIREARRSEREGLAPQADLVDVLGRRAEFWRPLAEDQGRDLQVSLPPGPLAVRASAPDLETLVDALLDNAFSHTPEGVAIALHVRAGDPVVLVIADSGPGFPAGLDPLTRGDSAGGSTGLGLDIVRRTSQAAGGGVQVGAAPEGGAVVTVTLGAAMPGRLPRP